MWRNEITVTRRGFVTTKQTTKLAGSDPVWPTCGRPNAPSGVGVAPGQFLPRRIKDPGETTCHCSNPPKPEIPKRKYYVKIDEPLAITMEKYAEFIQTDSIDHVIAQALDFVFRKDTDFKAWLTDGSGTRTLVTSEDEASEARSTRETA